MVKKSEIVVGGTYKTALATWTVEHITDGGLVDVRREDGRTTQFWLDDFARWVLSAREGAGA